MRRASGVYRFTYDRSQSASFGNSNFYAFVGASKRGRIDKPMTFTGIENFENVLGKPNYRDSGFTGIAAANVLRQQTPIHYQRVVGGAYRYANIVFGADTALSTASSDAPDTAFVNPKNTESWDGTATLAGTFSPMFLAHSIGPASDYNNYDARIVSANMRNVTITAAASEIDDDDSILAAGEQFEYAVLAVNALGTTIAEDTSLPAILSAASKAVSFTFSKVAAATGYMIFRRATGGPTYELYTTLSQVGGSATTLTFIDKGQYEQDAQTVLILDVADLKLSIEGVGVVYTKTKEFTFELYDPRINNSQPIESFVVTYDVGVDSQNNQTGIEEVINDELLGSQQIRIFKAAGPFSVDQKYMYTTPRSKLLNGADGSKYSSLTDAAFIDALQNYSNPDDFEVSIFNAGGRNTPAYLQALNEMCSTRNDSHFIAGMPKEYEEGTKALTWRTLILGINSRRGRVDFPSIEYYDTYTSEVIDVPADVITAALTARNDKRFGIYNATAGVKRAIVNDITGVRGVTKKYTPAELTTFANAQLNPIANISGYGLTIRDQFTLQTIVTALSYFSVSRTIDAIELAVAAYALTKLQDLPDELMDTDMESAINSILQVMKDRGAIKAFEVFVGIQAGNTPDLEIQGIRKYKLAITPNVPVREIELHTYITKDGVSFEEIVQSEAA